MEASEGGGFSIGSVIEGGVDWMAGTTVRQHEQAVRHDLWRGGNTPVSVINILFILYICADTQNIIAYAIYCHPSLTIKDMQHKYVDVAIASV